MLLGNERFDVSGNVGVFHAPSIRPGYAVNIAVLSLRQQPVAR
jgi:hypothetical protein